MEKQYCPYCMAPVTPGEPCRVCGLTEGSYTPSPHHLPLGTVLRERYLVGRVLGEGGFGITYIGCDLRLELKVAIKEYFPTDRANRVSAADLSVSSYAGQAGGRYEAGKERFLQEARTMARMEKMPVIVSVRDFFEVNNTAYIVMEYVEGTTFKELVEQRGGRLPAGELMHMIEPLFFALKAMHQLGLIHRDISPENLMLEHGEVRLLDFGCARESGDGGATLTIALKHGYAPVEQYQSKGQGPWTDVYALAATIYYCLTGRKPPQAMDRLVDDELVPPRQLGVELTARQEKALLQGMGVVPKRRFQSMEEFHTALYTGEFVPLPERAEPKKPAEPKPPREKPVSHKTGETPPPPGKARWKELLRTYWPFAAGAAAAVVLIAALVMWKPWAARPSDDELVSVSEPAEPPSKPVSGPAAPTDEPADEPQEPAVRAITDEESLALFANAAVLSEGGEAEFRALLEDPDVESIAVANGVYFDLYDSETVITKPVRLGKAGGIGFIHPVTIAEGGHLRVEGNADVVGMLRTTNGGSVLLSGGAIGGTGMIWLEKATDLAVPGGSVDIPSERTLVFDESIFEDAVRVKTYREYTAALSRREVKPIVIAADMSLEGHRNTSQHVPVLIEEGVHVHAPVARLADGQDDMAHYDAWDVNGTVLVNRGTITGRIVMGRWDSGSTPALLNYGTVHSGLYTADECKANPAVVNLGTMSIPQGGFNGGTFANLGTFLHGKLAPEGLEPAEIPERDGHWMDFRESTVYNAGHMELLGAGEVTEESRNGYCDMGFSRNSRFENAGTVEIGQYATLHNESILRNHGAIHVAEGGNFENPALVENVANAVLDAANGCYSTGVIQSGPEAELKLSADAFRHGGARLDFAWGSGIPAGTRFVSTAQQLRDAVLDRDCQAVILADGSSIRLAEPLRVTKGLVIPGRATLATRELTVADGGYVVCDGAINLQGHELRMEGSSKGVIHSLRGCGGIFIADTANVVLTDGEEMMNQNPNVSLTMRQGYLTTVGSKLRLEGVDVDIQNAVLRVCSGLDMRDCNVTVGTPDGGKGGEFLINGGSAYIDQNTAVTIHREAGFEINGTDTSLGGSLDVNLGGTFENYGRFGVNGGEQISGSVVNHGLFYSWNHKDDPIIVTGSFVNDGQMEFRNGGKFRASYGSTVEGVPEKYLGG